MILEAKKLKQREISKLLGIDQAEVSKLMNGHYLVFAGIEAGEGRAALEIWPCGYRAQCASPGCQNLARVILRRVAPGGAPDGQEEFCLRHARAGIVKAKAGGTIVYDMRTAVREL